MSVDTSSYYPEVNPPDGDKKDSLNERKISLFGDETSNFAEDTSAADDNNRENITENKNSPHQHLSKKEGWIKAADICSHFLSWGLVPLLMPVFGIIFIFRLSVLDVISPGMQTAFIFIIAGINLFVPMLLIILLKALGIVQDLGLNGQKERAIPYIITALCYGASAWFMAMRGAPVWVSMFFAGGGLASIINLIINRRWKISAHAAAIAGIIALLIRLEKDVAVEPQLFLWLLITVGAAGLLGSARIWLGRHTVWQVMAGYLVGFCSVFFLMAIH